MRETFAGHFKADLHVVDARERFLEALAGITDPQEKRSGSAMSSSTCSRTRRARIENVRFLAQGTLYPDVIESGGAVDGPAANIKTAPQRRRLARETGASS